jgi:hypothetical protein
MTFSFSKPTAIIQQRSNGAGLAYVATANSIPSGFPELPISGIMENVHQVPAVAVRHSNPDVGRTRKRARKEADRLTAPRNEHHLETFAGLSLYEKSVEVTNA